MTSGQRKKIQAIQALLVANSAKVGYEMVRPMKTSRIATLTELKTVLAGTGVVMEPDCSESFTLICHVAGAKCPTGFSYESGDGNTSTIASFLTHHYTNAKDALPGAGVLFNLGEPLPRQHIAMVHQADSDGGDPVVFNHGGPGCEFMRLSALASAFLEPPIFCSVAGL